MKMKPVPKFILIVAVVGGVLYGVKNFVPMDKITSALPQVTQNTQVAPQPEQQVVIQQQQVQSPQALPEVPQQPAGQPVQQNSAGMANLMKNATR